MTYQVTPTALLLLALTAGCGTLSEPSASLSAGGGGGGSSIVADIEKAMHAYGFDDASACWLFCTGIVRHPVSSASAGHVNVMTEGRKIDYGAGAQLASARVSGFSQSHGYLTYQLTSLHFEALAALRRGPLRLKGGPAIGLITVKHDHLQNEASSHFSPGAVVDVSLESGAERAFSLRIGARLRLMAPVTIGEAGYGYGDDRGRFPSVRAGGADLGWYVGFAVRAGRS